MTWSLRLQGGDLVKGQGNSLKTITGPEKVQQDLRLEILSNLGDDPLTPNYGSVIDFDSDVFVTLEEETLFVPEDRLDLIVEEIDRIIEGYQQRQYVRLQNETIAFNGRHTFSSGEIITGYGIEYEQVLTTLYIDIRLDLLSEETTVVSLTVEGESV